MSESAARAQREISPVAKGAKKRKNGRQPPDNYAEEASGVQMQQLLEALQAMRMGDFSVRLPGDHTGIAGKIADSFNEIAAANQHMAMELERAGDVVGRQGRPRHRVKLGIPTGAWAEMEDSVNTLIDDLLWPTTEVTRVIAAVAQGDLLQTVRLDVDGRPLKGEFLRSANIVNTMIQQLSVFTSEVTRVAREVGTEGKLGGQAQVREVTGVWKDLMVSVNSMTSDLVDPYRKTKQLEMLNAELEHRVAERTAALELSNSRLLKSEQGRRLSLAAGNMGSWEYDATEGQWHCDEGLNRILGLDPEDPGGLGSDAFFNTEEWRAFVSTFDELSPEKTTFQKEIRLRRRDGEARICFVAAAASFARGENPERIDGVMVDITDRKEAERMQKLLAREVDHRARNALANVQAIMRLTKADTLQEYATKVERRVQALAHTHELLSNARWQGADIFHLVHDELAPYGEGRSLICGPSVILSPETAQSVAMALHELATNAAKYGALSVADGRVRIDWSFDQNTLEVDWVEIGGPAVAPPLRSGFGTKIIQASMKRAKGDGADFDWDQKGLHCRLRISCGTAVADASTPMVPLDEGAVGRRRILVIEDEPLVGMLTCDYLDSLGYCAIGPYADLVKASAAAAAEGVDLALLDVSLAGQPIYPVARSLRARGVPFIFLTGFSVDSIDPEFEGTCIVAKPIDKDALAGAIGRALTSDPAFKQTA